MPLKVLAKKLVTLKDDAGEAMEKAGDKIGDMKDSISNKFGDMKTDAGNAIEDACEKAKESADAEDEDC